MFVHIGMSKAGSSAIQECLVGNRDTLAQHAISYPSAGIPGDSGSHHDILFDLQRDSTTKLRRALKSSSGDVTVLSCEGFWTMSDERLELFASVLPEPVTVVFYLRNPHDYLLSSYRQKIKRAGEHYPPEEHFDPDRTPTRLDFSHQLERWGQYFSLRVRAYEAVKQSIEKDFMEAIGAPMNEVDTTRQPINATPADGALHFMRGVNRYLPYPASKYVRRLIQWSDYEFGFMSPIEDETLHDYAEAVIQRWDTDVIREHLPEKDWNLLVN